MKKIALISLVLFSCESILFEPDLASDDPFDVFEYLWNEVDRKYSYFDLKQIDWDQIKVTYEAQIFEGMTEEELFEVLAAMINELRDDHSNLISGFNISRYDLALQSPANYLARTINEFYIPKAKITGPFAHDFIAEGEIGYVRYASFMATIEENQLDHILTRYAETRGIILDLRENGGGSIINIPLLLERFVSQRTLAGYFITRNGRGRNDFGKKANFFVGSHDGVRYE